MSVITCDAYDIIIDRGQETSSVGSQWTLSIYIFKL